MGDAPDRRPSEGETNDDSNSDEHGGVEDREYGFPYETDDVDGELDDDPVCPTLWHSKPCSKPTANWPTTFLTINLTIVFALFFLFLFRSNSTHALQNKVARLTPLFLDISFGLLVVSLVINFRDIREVCASISRRSWILAGLIALCGFVIVCFVTPRTHRIYYDEDIYGNIALSMSHAGKALLTHQAFWREGNFYLDAGEFNKQANAYPYLLSLIYRIVGPSELLSHLLNNLAFGVSIITVFLLGVFLFGKESLGLYAALAYATIPNNHRWGATMAAEPTTALFTGLSVLAALFYVQRPRSARMLLLVSVTSISVQFRVESVIVGVVQAAIIAMWRPSEYRGNRLYLGALLFLVLIPHYMFHVWSVRDNKWGSEHGKFALQNMWSDGRIESTKWPAGKAVPLMMALDLKEYKDGNLYNNIRFFFFDPLHRFPIPYAWLFLLGLLFGGPIRTYADWDGHKIRDSLHGMLIEAPWRGKGVILIWFGYSWGIFLLFYAGSYYYGADDRFSLLCFMPVALTIGIAVEKLQRVFMHWLSGPQTAWLMAVALILVFSRYMPVSQATGHEAWLARADHTFVEQRIKELPPNSLVLSHNPSIFNLWKVSSIQTFIGWRDPARLEYLLTKYPGRVFMHWGFWETIADVGGHRTNARRVLEKFDHEYLITKHLTHYTDNWERTFHWIKILGRKPEPVDESVIEDENGETETEIKTPDDEAPSDENGESETENKTPDDENVPPPDPSSDSETVESQPDTESLEKADTDE